MICPDTEKMNVTVNNICAAAVIKKGEKETLNLHEFAVFLVGLSKSKEYEKFRGALGESVALTYDPARFPALNLKLCDPRVSMKIFRNLKINVVGCTKESEVKKAVQVGADLVALFANIEKPGARTEIEQCIISNVMCSLNIKRTVGCGVISKIFPEKEVKFSKFAGGGYDISFDEGYVRIFSNGRIVASGFKSVDCAKEKISDVANKILEGIDKFAEERKDSCKAERLDPTRKLIEEYASQLKAPEEVTLKALELISQYCKKVTSESFGGSHESFASASIYIAGIFCGNRFTQEEICEVSGISEVTLRSAKDKIKETLDLVLIL